MIVESDSAPDKCVVVVFLSTVNYFQACMIKRQKEMEIIFNKNKFWETETNPNS